MLIIPSAEPQIRKVNDCLARFETIRNTFSSRIGQISNTALDRSIIAYNQNSTAEERERCRREVETLAILTGLEIDSAKSGIKPDLSEYLGNSATERSIFLKYKNLQENKDVSTAWYQPSNKKKMKDLIETTDWDSVTSNVERMPYLAHNLKENTAPIKQRKLPEDISDKISAAVPEHLQEKVSYLVAYYLAHKPADSDWVVLPVVSFDAFFGGTTFSKKILSRLPKNIIIRDRTGYGVSRYKVSQELIWEELERCELQKALGE